MGHAEREHSILSASGAFRWLACTPSAMLEQQFEDSTSSAAREGTLAHELAELKLRNYFYTTDCGKRKLTTAINKLKKRELWQDEMQGYTDDYLDYIKSIALGMKSAPYAAIEKRVYFGDYTMAKTMRPDDSYEGFGTADCILICGNVIHVIDFKYGKSPNGRVSAENNPQMMLYALGAYETYKLLYPIENIKMSIVQPRLPDGISEWTCSLLELLVFGDYVKGRAKLAWEGTGEFAPDPNTCKFCKARGKCQARAQENVRLAFSPDMGKLPPLITNEQMGQYLIQGSDLAKWLSDLQDCALAECLAGHEVPGWKAVEGRGSRDWTDMDEAFDTLVRGKVTDETMLWERKPLTLARVEKLVGKKDFADTVGKYVIKKPGKPALVKESDKREAITNIISAEDAFKEEI